jgi:hypothetical protein
MNNRNSSFTRTEDDLIMEGLASSPPAELSVIDRWMNDPDTLRIAGKIALSEPDIRRLLVATPEFQNWVKSPIDKPRGGDDWMLKGYATDPEPESETRLPVRDMDEKGIHN